MASRADLVDRLRSLQDGYARCVGSIDRGDLGAAGEQGRGLMDGIQGAVQAVQSGLSEDFITNRLRYFHDDRRTLDGLAASPTQREDLGRVAAHLGDHLTSLERLINVVHPRPPFPLRKSLQVHWAKIAAVVAAILVIFAGVAARRAYVSHRQGLEGQYFADMELKELAKERRDENINFAWGTAGPFAGWKKSAFSARWTGFIRIPRTGDWEFQMYSDDGVRLTIADRLVIDNWNRKNKVFNRTRLHLEAGYYPIKLEYFQFKKRASVKLFWKLGKIRMAPIVPPTAFVPTRDLLPNELPVFD